MDFYHLQENIKKQLLDKCVVSLKTTSKKVIHKASEYLGNKTADVVTKSNDDEIVKKNLLKK